MKTNECSASHVGVWRRLSAFVLAVWFAVIAIFLPSTAYAFLGPYSTVAGKIAAPAAATGPAAAVIDLALTSRGNPTIAALMIGYMVYKIIDTNLGVGIRPSAVPENVPSWPGNTPPATGTSPVVHSVLTRQSGGVGSAGCSSGPYTDKAPATWGAECTVAIIAAGWTGTLTNAGSAQCPSAVTTVAGQYSCSITSNCNCGPLVLNNVQSTTCSAGYTLNAGVCTLSNSSLVVYPPATGTEALPVLTPSADGLSLNKDTRHPAALPTGVTTGVSSLEYSVDMGNGLKTLISYAPQSGGALKVEVKREEMINGEKYTYVQNMTTNNSGAVTNTNSYTAPGPAWAVNAAAPTAVPAAQATGGSGGTSQPFPTDYNRESTQTAIKDELQATTAPTMVEQGPLVDTAKADGEQKLLDAHTSAKSGLVSDRSMWVSWLWTPSAAACTDPDLTANGVHVTFPICGRLGMIRDALGFLFAVFAAWDIYNEIFRRRSSI